MKQNNDALAHMVFELLDSRLTMPVLEAFNEDELDLFKSLCHHWELLAIGEIEDRAKRQKEVKYQS
ncbi:MAG: hypothetical protein L3J67_12275 [Hyphomicrobiaceae bacterium]|nr:hypothetical protein [Hyphomicrobiaceae bacterium]